MIYTSSQRIDEIDSIIKKGYTKGYGMPFYCLDDLYSLKLGATSYYCGHEYSGKSEFLFERDIWLSQKYGLTHCIFTPETGNVDEILLEIAQKWVGQTFIGEYGVDEKTRYKALQTISSYFHIISVDNEITMEGIFKMLDDYENKNGIRINTLTIDPFNELQWNMNGLPRDMWLENTLGDIRRQARVRNKHITIITHPIESDRLYHKDGYMLAPTRKQYAGGQGWARKGESMLAIWRPPAHVENGEGIPYEDNECHIIVQKSKPKGTGKLGIGVIYFDWKKSRYYEYVGGTKYYAGEFFETDEYKALKSINEPKQDIEPFNPEQTDLPF